MLDFTSAGAGWCVVVVAMGLGLAILVWVAATAIVFVARRGNATVRESAEGIAAVFRSMRRRHP